MGGVFKLHNFAIHEQSLVKAERLLELCEAIEKQPNTLKSTFSEEQLRSYDSTYSKKKQEPKYLETTASVSSKKREKYILVQGKTKQQKLEEQKQHLENQRRWLKREPSINSEDFNEALNSRYQA